MSSQVSHVSEQSENDLAPLVDANLQVAHVRRRAVFLSRDTGFVAHAFLGLEIADFAIPRRATTVTSLGIPALTADGVAQGFICVETRPEN
jgi:hypothetical protein